MTAQVTGAMARAMHKPRQRILVLSLATLTPLLAVCWAAAVFSAHREAAETAALEASTCQELAARIERANRAHPEFSGDDAATKAPSDLAAEVARAATSAGIDDRDLERIEPERLTATATERVNAESDDPRETLSAGRAARVTEQSIVVSIRRATLEQIVRFLYSVSSSAARLSVRRLRITAPQDHRGGESPADNAWAVEATLVPRGRAASAVDAVPVYSVARTGTAVGGAKAAGVR